MTENERKSRAADVEIGTADPASEEARYCFEQYFAELASRFHGGFDADAYGSGSGQTDFAPPGGCLLIARLDGQTIGCGALRTLTSDTGEIKRMWIAPDARGLGLGRRLLAELENQAMRRGFRIVRLDTNATLDEALTLYRSSGYREIPRFNDNPYAHHWFEKTLS
jgi:ribosomal protein S18 acetylase RimI-like enzyme